MCQNYLSIIVVVSCCLACGRHYLRSSDEYISSNKEIYQKKTCKTFTRTGNSHKIYDIFKWQNFQQNLLYSLNLPSSFPCLAPPPHETCCQCMTLIQNSPGESLTNSNRRALSSSNSSLITINPVIIPSYEQVMRGAKTFLLSKSAFPSTSASTVGDYLSVGLYINWLSTVMSIWKTTY